MATPQEIITELYSTHFVENYTRQFCGVADMQNYEDIIQELYAMICEIPANKLTKAYNRGGINAVRRYVSGLITRQMRSDHSTIYRKYTMKVYTELPVNDFTQWHERSD